MKKYKQLLPIIILSLIVLIQLYYYLFIPTNYEAYNIRDLMVNVLQKNRVALLGAKSSQSDPKYLFAEKINKDLPLDARVLYINDATDGTEMDKYYKIRLWMDNIRESFFEYTYMPANEQIIAMMKKYNANFLVTYDSKEMLNRFEPNSLDKSAIYIIRNNNLEIYKVYE